MNVENRLRNERMAIRELIRIASDAGWNLVGVNDGEELHLISHEPTVLDHIFSVDESKMYFAKEGIRASVFIVLGNSGAEVIADYGSSDLDQFDREVMHKHNDWADAHADHFYESEV